jgi:citrate synthase
MLHPPLTVTPDIYLHLLHSFLDQLINLFTSHNDPFTMPSAIPPKDNNFLAVFDGRTGQSYELPIYRNTIRGSDLSRIQAPPEECHAAESMYNHTGLRLFDPGFENVAVMESSITFT